MTRKKGEKRTPKAPWPTRFLKPDFALAWDVAVDAAADALELEARRRAVEGTEKPVFFQGYECGRIREYSDTLLIVLLKANRPGKFRERVEHTFLKQAAREVREASDEELLAVLAEGGEDPPGAA